MNMKQRHARPLGRLFLMLGAMILAAAASRVSGEEASHSAAHDAAAHDAGGGHAEHGGHIGHANASPGLETNPAEVKSDLALFTFVVFLILFGVLWKFAWGPISAGLDKREHSIADDIEAAKRAHEEAKQLLAEHERKLAGTAAEVHAMIETARRDGENLKTEILAEAKASADAERARGVRDVEAATEQALQQLAERSANLAVELAGKIVTANLSAGDHSRLIQEAMSRFPGGSPSSN